MWQKATFFLLPPRETEEGRGGRRRRLAGDPRPRWRMGGGGKERGHHGNLIPGRGLSGGGPWEPGHGGGRRLALAGAVAALQGPSGG